MAAPRGEAGGHGSSPAHAGQLHAATARTRALPHAAGSRARAGIGAKRVPRALRTAKIAAIARLSETMPPALKALLAQLVGGIGAYVLARHGLLNDLGSLVAAQAAIATGTAAAMRSARWWLPIHLVFLPLAVTLRGLGLPPGLYLAAFVILLLIYWTTFRTQVPLYLSNAETAAAVAQLLPSTPVSVLDIGAGTGSLLRPLARLRPDCRFAGIELAPAPWLIGRILGARLPNLTWRRGDLFTPSWTDYDVVYAFLSPVPMGAVWGKASAEMRAGSLLISNSFPLPAREPDFVAAVGDRRGTRLYLYRIPAQRPAR